MDTSETYVKMCEKAVKQSEIGEAYKRLSPESKWGSIICFRSFMGMVVLSSKRKELTGIASFMPETLAIRLWCEDNTDIRILKGNLSFSDEGFPVFRQDQLQEMVTDCAYDIRFSTAMQSLIYHLNKFMEYNSVPHCNSMEQLWLAFVMNEEYGKAWNGEDWVTEIRKVEER